MSKKRKSGNTSTTIEVPPPKNPQQILNDLVYKHGINFRNQDAPRLDALREVGIDPATVTDLMWDRAEEMFHKRLKAESEGRRLVWCLTPIDEKWSTGPVTRWESECGRYAVLRFVREGRLGTNYAAEQGKPGSRKSVETDPHLGNGYARYYLTLKEAVGAVIRFHIKQHRVDETRFSDNSTALLAAEKDHISLPDNETDGITSEGGVTEQVDPGNNEKEVPMPATATETVTIKESKVRNLLESMKVPGVGDMTLKTLQKRILKVETYKETGECPEDGTPESRTLDKIQEALRDGATIQVVADEERNGHGDAPATKPSKTTSTSKDKTKPAKPAKPAKGGESVGKDRFGNRLGSQAAAINAVLGARPKSFDKIAEDSGQAIPRVRSHMKWLLEEGHVTQEDKGFVVKK